MQLVVVLMLSRNQLREQAPAVGVTGEVMVASIPPAERLLLAVTGVILRLRRLLRSTRRLLMLERWFAVDLVRCDHSQGGCRVFSGLETV